VQVCRQTRWSDRMPSPRPIQLRHSQGFTQSMCQKNYSGLIWITKMLGNKCTSHYERNCNKCA
jgi:hypothetical protein